MLVASGKKRQVAQIRGDRVRAVAVDDDHARVLGHALGRIDDHVAREADLVRLQEIVQVGLGAGPDDGDQLAAAVADTPSARPFLRPGTGWSDRR